MKANFLYTILIVSIFAVYADAQDLPQLKLKGDAGLPVISGTELSSSTAALNDFQLPKRKPVNMYFGAGYSFVIFTAHDMNTVYPIFEQSTGNFLSEVNLFFGFAIAKALTLEAEPSILFTHSNRYLQITLAEPRNINGTNYGYVYPTNISMLAFPLAVNLRFFPFFTQKNFIRLFFVGAGAGGVWVREEYDNYYSRNASGYFYADGPLVTESTSQWAPLLRIMTGFTGTGGMFGFGGELRYNFVPLKKGTNSPFATNFAANYNSVDIALRFYFSL